MREKVIETGERIQEDMREKETITIRTIKVADMIDMKRVTETMKSRKDTRITSKVDLREEDKDQQDPKAPPEKDLTEPREEKPKDKRGEGKKENTGLTLLLEVMMSFNRILKRWLSLQG